jgi:hypothetical protein
VSLAAGASAPLTPRITSGKTCETCHGLIHGSILHPQSAKIRTLLDLLARIRSAKAGEKTIVFSQFTSFLDLVEPFLKREKYDFVRCEWAIFSNGCAVCHVPRAVYMYMYILARSSPQLIPRRRLDAQRQATRGARGGAERHGDRHSHLVQGGEHGVEFDVL